MAPPDRVTKETKIKVKARHAQRRVLAVGRERAGVYLPAAGSHVEGAYQFPVGSSPQSVSFKQHLAVRREGHGRAGACELPYDILTLRGRAQRRRDCFAT